MKVLCKQKCSYGAKGDLIDLGKVDKLTERQKVMLEPYEPKEAKKITKEPEPEK